MNFDAAAAIDLVSLNDLLLQYFTQANKDQAGVNPFDDSMERTVEAIGLVHLKWKLGATPILAFGPPQQADWDAALDIKGQTNGANHTPLPTGAVARLTIPSLDASYQTGTAPKVGGTAANVVAYATLTFPAGEVDVRLVGLFIDEASFSTWDKAIFNDFLVPKIFEAVTEMLGVVHVPTLEYGGVALNPVQISLQGDRLFAAATLTSNTAQLDISGLSWPNDPLFAIVSTTLLNAALKSGIEKYQNKPFSKSGDYKDLAKWNYSGSVTSLTATVQKVSPFTVAAEISLDLSGGAELTAAGMALVAAGCALGAAVSPL